MKQLTRLVIILTMFGSFQPQLLAQTRILDADGHYLDPVPNKSDLIRQGEIQASASTVYKGKGTGGRTFSTGIDDNGRLVLEGKFEGGKHVIISAKNYALDRVWELTNGVYRVTTISTGAFVGALDGDGKAMMKKLATAAQTAPYTTLGDIKAGADTVYLGKSVTGDDAFIGIDHMGRIVLEGSVTKKGAVTITRATNFPMDRLWTLSGGIYKVEAFSTGAHVGFLDATGKKQR